MRDTGRRPVAGKRECRWQQGAVARAFRSPAADARHAGDTGARAIVRHDDCDPAEVVVVERVIRRRVGGLTLETVLRVVLVERGLDRRCAVHHHDAETDEPCGTLTDEQFEALTEALEEEGPEDQDYYINVEVIDMLEAGGADPDLVRVLRKALAGRDEMDVRWERT